MSLVSHAVYKTFEGTSRNYVRYVLINQFHILDELRKYFFHYKLIKLPYKEFIERMSYGTIKEQGISYGIVFKNCSRGEILAKVNAGIEGDVLLSFRICQSEFDFEPIVLVKIATPVAKYDSVTEKQLIESGE